MFRLSTISVAKATADTLSYRNVLLQPKSSSLAVGVVTNHFNAPIEPTYKVLSTSEANAVKERFAELNKNQSKISEDEFNEIVELMSYGIRRMVTTIRNNVVPLIKDLTENTQWYIDKKQTPDVRIETFMFHPIHSEVGLADHVLNSYGDVRQLDVYRVFMMDYPGHESLINWISKNGMVSPEVTKQWLVGLNENDLRRTWEQTFLTDRSIKANTGVFDKTRLPFEIDQLLAVYFLTIYLAEEPQTVIGESVTLEEWQQHMRVLHRYAGALLSYCYQKRIKDLNGGVIVYNYQLPGVYDGIYAVTVNGELIKPWLENGGDIKMVFGALVSNPALKSIAQLEEHRDELIKVWDRKYYMLKQLTQDSSFRNSRDGLKSAFMSTIRRGDNGFELPETLTFDEISKRLDNELAVFKEKDFEDLPTTIKCLVCRVLYPNTPYLEYLNSMDNAAKEAPELNAREAGLIALIDLVGSWLAKQIDVTIVDYDYSREDDSNAVSAEPALVDSDEVERKVIEEKPDDATSQSEQVVSDNQTEEKLIADKQPEENAVSA